MDHASRDHSPRHIERLDRRPGATGEQFR